ncbi:hypothetical protein SAMN02744775_04292 [Enterobacter sp. CC120223-11]|nr:hypothetical protein SAMN02744775_04292 [Enterobacter sp. CC120223-11]
MPYCNCSNDFYFSIGLSELLKEPEFNCHAMESTLIVCAYKSENLRKIHRCIAANITAEIKHIVILNDDLRFNVFSSDRTVSIISCDHFLRSNLLSVIFNCSNRFNLPFSDLTLDCRSVIILEHILEHGTIKKDFDFFPNLTYKTIWNYKYKLMAKLRVSSEMKLLRFITGNKFTPTGKLIL